MSRSLTLAANPLRIFLLLLALALLGIVALAFNATATPLHSTGSHSTGPLPGPAPNLDSQLPAGASQNQAVQVTTRVVTASGQSAPIAPAASAGTNTAPAQVAPIEPGCGAAGPPVAPGVASRCPGG